MIKQSGIPIASACNSFSISKQTYYRWEENKDKADLDTKLRPVIQEIALEFPKYGYRRMTKELRRRGFTVNHKRILRIMGLDNLLCLRKRFKPVTTQSNHRLPVYQNLIIDLEVTGVNQLWVADITYIRLLHEFVYLAVIIDIFSRRCIGWELSRDIDTCLTLGTLNKAIAIRQHLGFSKLIHHSDQGVQYASQDYVGRLTGLGIKISMSRQGNVYDNAFAESFIKTLKYEEVNMNEYRTFEEAYINIKRFIEEVYNKKRLHSSIGYLPPNEFEQEVLNRSGVR